MDWTKAFTETDTTKLFLDSGRKFWIEVRNELSHAEDRAISLGSFRRLYRGDEQLVELDPRAGADQKVLTWLVDWNVVGKDGKTIRTAKGKKEGDGLGAAAASIGDADGDGVPDFVGGAPGVDAKKDAKNDFGLSGAVMAFSGKTAKPLWTTTGTDYSQRLGIAVAAIGDVDGDGVSDVAAGAPAFGAGAGQVFVISGKSGQVLGTVREGD